jgi:hypothetical protein
MIDEGIEIKLSEYNASQKTFGNNNNDRRNEINELRLLLAARSPHLPGHSWCGDWVQWMRNNHPLLGICCKYPDHPIGIRQRLIILVGSIAFGLSATNFIYLFYHLSDDEWYLPCC